MGVAVFALALSSTFQAQTTHAGTLAQLQMQLQARSVHRVPHLDLCVGGARTPGCRAALDAALHPATQPALFNKIRASQALPGSFGASAAGDTASHDALPLKFNTDPEWKKRAIVMAHEGLTFLRLPQGPSHEFLVGINRQGRLGFSLRDTTGE